MRPLHVVSNPDHGNSVFYSEQQQEIAELLYKAGANVNELCAGRCTPLHFAAANDCSKPILFLLEIGANLELRTDNGQTALDVAIIVRGLDAAKAPIERRAAMKVASNQRKETVFQVATTDFEPCPHRALTTPILHSNDYLYGKPLQLLLLIIRNGYFQVSGREGGTDAPLPQESTHDKLARLVYNKDATGVSKLLEYEPNFSSVDLVRIGLHVSADRGFEAGVRMFLDAGATINGQELNGRTALHHAVAYGYYDIAKLLIEKSADIGLMVDNGSTCMDLMTTVTRTTLQFMKKHSSNVFSTRNDRLSSETEPDADQAAWVRQCLTGFWSGSWHRTIGRSDDGVFGFQILDKMGSSNLERSFSSLESGDWVGRFSVDEFVDDGGMIWFNKSYPQFGWLYCSELSPDGQVIKGYWGRAQSVRGTWYGEFQLSRGTNDG
jgi:ankyrin repeat protein